MNPITVFLTIACAAIGVALGALGHIYWGAGFIIAAVIIAFGLKMANTWEKFVILRAGKLRGVKPRAPRAQRLPKAWRWAPLLREGFSGAFDCSRSS